MSAIKAPPALASAPPPPPVTGWPRPLRWTVALFHAVNSTGAFAGRRPMLIRGVLLEQGPMNEPHATAIEVATEALRATFGTGWRVRAQLPLILGQETDPFPDFAIVVGGSRDGTPTMAALVIEVSDTTLAFDMTAKAELYATARIPEYWVVDLVNRRLLVYRDPAPLPPNLDAVAYTTHQTLGPNDTVSPLAAPGSTVRVADLLP